MLSIIYTYRNRDLERLKNSFNSLDNQSVKDFEVVLVDYGSMPEMANKVKQLCNSFSFVSYKYCYTQYQPWNKSKALNSIIKDLEHDYCFVADLDIIFHPEFLHAVLQLQQPKKAIYFQVGFLNSDQKLKDAEFFTYSSFRNSTDGATGLCLFPVKALKEIKGFDEFYHFWGAEDTDVHLRLKNAGYGVEFYDAKILMLHQWHPSYRSLESEKLSKDYQISGIVQINHEHQALVEDLKIRRTNKNGWGNIMSKEQYERINKASVRLKITTEKRQIDNLLFGFLPGLENGIIKVVIEDTINNSSKSQVKKLLGKKTPSYYSLKMVNDKILLHLISFYRDKPYMYKIAEDLKSLEIAIEI